MLNTVSLSSISRQIFAGLFGVDDLDKHLGMGAEHPQVAGDGDELHTLVCPLQRILRVHDVDPGGRTRFLSDGDHALNHGFHCGVGRFATVRRTHVETQVVRSDEDGIAAGQAVNRRGIFHTGWAFRLEDDKNLVVGALVVLAA